MVALEVFESSSVFVLLIVYRRLIMVIPKGSRIFFVVVTDLQSGF